MTERSRPWAGISTGDAGPYTDQHWSDIWETLFGRSVANSGVLRDVAGELAASGATSPVAIAAGSAIVNGTWYQNDASLNVAVPTPGGATRIDRIVLRKTWATQTVRITRIAGAEGGGAPAMTQSDGVTWDIPLVRLSITTGGAITLTDERYITQFASEFDPSVVDGRLTLTSGTPVTTANVTAATSIYFTPFKGNRIALYDGTRWRICFFSEMTLALGTLTSGLPYDVFIYDNAGALTLELLAWSSGTARATALATQNGILVKSGDATRRYLGTFYTTSTTQTEDSDSRRLLWNYYNRVRRQLKAVDTTNTWNYSTASWREANASTALGVARVEFVLGWAEVLAEAVASGLVEHSTGSTGNGDVASIGVGLDTITANSAQVTIGSKGVQLGISKPMQARYRGYPAVGYHYFNQLEIGDGTGNTNTWFGDNGGTVIQTGLVAEVES